LCVCSHPVCIAFEFEKLGFELPNPNSRVGTAAVARVDRRALPATDGSDVVTAATNAHAACNTAPDRGALLLPSRHWSLLFTILVHTVNFNSFCRYLVFGCWQKLYYI
jgi:hypothetical protein